MQNEPGEHAIRDAFWELLTAVVMFFFYHPPTFETKHANDEKRKWQLVKEIEFSRVRVQCQLASQVPVIPKELKAS